MTILRNHIFTEKLRHNHYRPYGIGVATGEMCCNRVMFKQFMQAKGLEYCQIDSARIGGINEILSVYLMAYKLNGKINDFTGILF